MSVFNTSFSFHNFGISEVAPLISGTTSRLGVVARRGEEHLLGSAS